MNLNLKGPTMNIRLTLTALATGIALLTSPGFAGGPVIVEDAYAAEAPATKRKVPAWVFLALGAVVVAAIAGGGGDVCTAEEVPVEPTPEPC